MKKVLIFGTFDILHPGHVFFINKAKSFGDIVIASVARDDFVMKMKAKPPENDEKNRLKLILERKLVDKAFLSDKIPGTYSIIKEQKPDIICIGYDQFELYNNLKKWLSKNKLDVKVIKLDAFSPEKYKSSKINSHRIYNTELKNIDDMVFMAVDIETTGLNPVHDRIIEIGAVLFNTKGMIDTFQKLVNPGVLIPDSSIKIHGITNRMIENEEGIGNVLRQFQAFAHGACPAAHNAYFDCGFLLYDLSENNINLTGRPVFDTLTVSRNIFKNMKGYSLRNLVKELGITGSGFHRALSDSLYCMDLFFRCIEEIKKKKKSLNTLFDYNIDEKSLELTLSWKDILLERNMIKVIDAIEKKVEIEIKYLFTGKNYVKYNIKPVAVSIYKKKFVLAAQYKGSIEVFLLDKMKL